MIPPADIQTRLEILPPRSRARHRQSAVAISAAIRRAPQLSDIGAGTSACGVTLTFPPANTTHARVMARAARSVLASGGTVALITGARQAEAAEQWLKNLANEAATP